jgi:hypothetical protein
MSENPVILSIMHHRHNPLQSTNSIRIYLFIYLRAELNNGALGGIVG